MKLSSFCMLSLLLLIALSCSSDSNSHDEAYQYCLDNEGTVDVEEYPNGESRELCVYTETATFDDGEQTFTHRCGLMQFYNDRCEEGATEDFLISRTSRSAQKSSTPRTIAELYSDKVEDILTKLNNTGYSHNKDHNFMTVPHYGHITESVEEYNLFLDCSGYVGYYVVQGLTKGLYEKLTPSDYQCGNRPLAADFADMFANAREATGNNTAILQDLHEGNACWGRVMNIKDARPGDILVYKHNDNISGHKTCDNGKRVHKVSGNTGHVLFIHATPYRSNRCKDNHFSCGIHQYVLPGDWQWVVEVSDSTTSRHSNDSRHGGKNHSKYNGHRYHAWTRVDRHEPEGVERCANGTYHRQCSEHNTTAVEHADINTEYDNNPTGIGVGKMYISDDMKNYRTRYTADIHSDNVSVYIGRPIVCE